MKPRARRVTIAAAVLGTAVLAVLVITHWGAVRDHVEAWYLQVTRKTLTIEQDLESDLPDLIEFAFIEPSRRPVFLVTGAGSELAAQALREDLGGRVLEQRFPRRAYVLILGKP